MTEVGRNEPCHCGSGKKYKKCCRVQDEEQARARLRAAHEEERRREAEMQELDRRRAVQKAASELVETEAQKIDNRRIARIVATEMAEELGLLKYEDDGLDELSNSVIDLLDERRFDEALRACDRLLREFPDVHDGFERSALVHDALGNHALAVEFWQKTVDFVEHPDRRPHYDEEGIDDYRQHLAAAQARAQPVTEAERALSDDQERAP